MQANETAAPRESVEDAIERIFAGDSPLPFNDFEKGRMQIIVNFVNDRLKLETADLQSRLDAEMERRVAAEAVVDHYADEQSWTCGVGCTAHLDEPFDNPLDPEPCAGDLYCFDEPGPTKAREYRNRYKDETERLKQELRDARFDCKTGRCQDCDCGICKICNGQPDEVTELRQRLEEAEAVIDDYADGSRWVCSDLAADYRRKYKNEPTSGDGGDDE